MNGASSDKANVMAPPPLIFASALMAGWLINDVVPQPVLPAGVAPWVGLVLMILPVPFAASALLALRRAQTPVDPYKPTSAIVRTGAFRFSRNPLYVSLIAIYLGLGCLINSLWIVLMVAPAVALLWFGVVQREEHYLERKFGEPYRRYKAEVRRWL